MPQRYLDDFSSGEAFKSASHTLSDKDFAAFAEITGDAHPLHYDFDYARAKGWDAPIGHELTLLILSMLGNDVRYKRPAFIGDTVTPQFTVVSVEPKTNDRGIVRLAVTLYNQRNEVVLEGTHVLMLKRRASVK